MTLKTAIFDRAVTIGLDKSTNIKDIKDGISDDTRSETRNRMIRVEKFIMIGEGVNLSSAGNSDVYNITSNAVTRTKCLYYDFTKFDVPSG